MTEPARQRCPSCARLLPRLRKPPVMPEVYASEIKLLRASLGWSQAELANQLGVTVLTVTRWENGVHPHRSNLDRICRLAQHNGRTFK